MKLERALEGDYLRNANKSHRSKTKQASTRRVPRNDDDADEWIRITNENCCELLADKVNITIRIHDACSFHGFTVYVLLAARCGVMNVETIISISEPDGSADWAISLKEDFSASCPKERNCYYGSGPAVPMAGWNWKGHKTDGKYLGKLPGDIKSLWGATVKVHVKANSCCDYETEAEGGTSWI